MPMFLLFIADNRCRCQYFATLIPQ